MPRRKIRERNILFLCPDNSCSSQIAEAIAKRLAPPKTRVFSAGIAPGKMHPAVAQVMKEVDVDTASQSPKGLEAVPINEIDLVVMLGQIKEKFPTFPAKARLAHWAIPDLQRVTGGDAAMQAAVRYLRDHLDKKVAALFLDYWRNVA